MTIEPVVLTAQGIGPHGPVNLTIRQPRLMPEGHWSCTYDVRGLEGCGLGGSGHGSGDTPYQAFNLACDLMWLIAVPAPLHFRSWLFVPSEGAFGVYLRELEELMAAPPPPARTMCVAGGQGEDLSVILTQPAFMPGCGQWTVLLRAPARVAPDQAHTAESADLALLLALMQVHALSGRPSSGDLPEETIY
jgi:hypothetical protein